MSKVFAGTAMLAVLAGIYFIGRAIVALVRKEPLGVFVKRIFIAAAVVVVASVGSYLVQTPEERAAIQAKREAKAQTDTDKRIAEVEKAPEPVDPPKQPAAEELAEQQRLAEEKRRQQEEIRQQRLAEERAAREAERDERRPTIDEFESRFLSIIGADVMGEAQTFSNRITYPLDATGEMTLTEFFKGDRVNSVEIYVKRIHKNSVMIALLAYYDAIRAHNPNADINAVARGLSLDETIMDNLTKPQTTNINGILYSKRIADKALILSISY